MYKKANIDIYIYIYIYTCIGIIGWSLSRGLFRLGAWHPWEGACFPNGRCSPFVIATCVAWPSRFSSGQGIAPAAAEKKKVSSHAPRKRKHKPCNDDSLYIPTNNGLRWFQSGAGFRPSIVLLGGVFSKSDESPLNQGTPPYE